MNKIITKLIITVFCFTIISSISSASESDNSDYTNHWAYEYIEHFLEEGFIILDDDGNFKPDEPITKADFASITNKAFNFEYKYWANFKDIEQSDIYYDDFLKARGAGYLAGYPDGTIKPLNYFTREEFAVIIGKLLKLDFEKNIIEAEKFSDAYRFQSWSKGAIGAVAKNGYMNGLPGGNFDPGGHITRAQAVTVLKKCYMDDRTNRYSGTSHYVSVNGNDSNIGTIDKPWRTFKKAVESVNAGDTVYVMQGTYNERLIINKSGNAGDEITFKAYLDDIVTIDGNGLEMATWAGLVDIQRQSHIRISGFDVINSPAMGIMACDSDYITIDNNYIYNTFSPGIHTWGDKNLLIDGNKVEKACTVGDGALECISLRNCDTFQISDNIVFDSKNIGIDMAEGCTYGKIFNNEVYNTGLGIYLDAWDKYAADMEVFDNVCYSNGTGFCVNTENGGLIEDIKIYRNISYDNTDNGFAMGWGGVYEASHTVKDVEIHGNLSYGNGENGICIFGVKEGYIDDVRIYNNLVYDNMRVGIAVFGVAKEPNIYSIKNIQILNNTIVDNGSEEMWGSGGIFISNPVSKTGVMEKIIIRNNIISNNLSFTIAVWKFGNSVEDIVIDSNLVHGYLNDVNNYGEILGTNSVKGIPSFVDSLNNDYHITSESEAIDIGSSKNAPSIDFDENQRPQGEKIDIGAYEFVTVE